MKTIGSWNDLRAHGIEVLTGEACGLSYRILCDVTARGKATIEKALGVRELRLPEGWNRGEEGDPHVGSILLAPELLPLLGSSPCWKRAVPRSGGRPTAACSASSRATTRRRRRRSSVASPVGSSGGSPTPGRRGTGTSTRCPAGSS